MTTWNPVLKVVCDIKNEYKRVISEPTYDYISGYTNESKTCVERWIEELCDCTDKDRYKMWQDMFSCLEINQYNNLILIRYARYSNVCNGEIEVSGEDLWDKYNGFYRECRSIVIDVIAEKIVLCPFKKFFNINELEETSLENIQKRINNAKCIEFSDKLDGSMQSATYYNGKFIMSGSRTLNPNNSWRLADGYRMLKSDPNYLTMIKSYSDCTFIFEYISLKDAHLVKYTEEQEGLYLIGIRNNINGYEFPYSLVIHIAHINGVKTTQLFNKTLGQVMSELNDKTSDEAEGFVINIDDYKVKLKYNDYVYLHKAISKLSSTNLIIRSIADNTYDDLLSKVPNVYHDRIKEIANKVFDYIQKTEKKIIEYYNRAPKDDKKHFMIWINENVPKDIKGYCKQKYLGQEYNLIKTGNNKNPHYKKLSEMCKDSNNRNKERYN